MALTTWGITLPRRVAVSGTLVFFVLVAMLKGSGHPGGRGGWEWLLDLAAAVAGGFLIRYGFRQLRKKNLIENIPSSPIRSVAMGLAEIKGHSLAAATMTAPLSGKPCHYFRYRVEEERNSGKRREWVTVDQGESNAPFSVEDPTARILVNPDGADILLNRDYERMERGEGWFGKRRRYREWRIDPADFVYVIGTVSKLRDRIAERRLRLQEELRQLKKDPEAVKRFDRDGSGQLDEAEWAGAVSAVKDDLLRRELAEPPAGVTEDLVVGAGELEPIFVISDRDEKSVAASMGWKAFAAVGFGGMAALGMSVSILGRFEVLPGGWTFPWESLFQ
jgi:E3 ubiquitin ligase